MMKTRLCLISAAVLLMAVGASAQKKDLSSVPAKTVTLVSPRKEGGRNKGLFNFQFGVRGDKAYPGRRNAVSLKGLPDNTGVIMQGLGGGNSTDVPETANPFRTSNSVVPLSIRDDQVVQRPLPPERYDISFGSMTFNRDNNWLALAHPRGSRSVMKDLGALSWSDVTSAPPLDPSPVPHDGRVGFTSRGVVAQYGAALRAVAGHMYALRVKDGKADYYVLFRVESLDPSGECTLTWKRAPVPKS